MEFSTLEGWEGRGEKRRRSRWADGPRPWTVPLLGVTTPGGSSSLSLAYYRKYHFLLSYSHCPPLIPSLPQISSPFPCQNSLILCSLPGGKSLTQSLILGRGVPGVKAACRSPLGHRLLEVYDTVFDLGTKVKALLVS